MLNENGYQDFSETDFICDPSFQEWVTNPTEENELFWKKFFEANPNKKVAGENARSILTSIKFREDFPAAELIERSFENHLAEIEKVNARKVVPIDSRYPLRKLLKIAALVAGIVLTISAILILNKQDKPVLVQNGYGNIKSILLPDSSSVVLNGNSSLKFSDNWSTNDPREVWLQGEAFFDIRHINRDTDQVKKYEQFIVHTESLKVEVLGTSFDIRQRRGTTEVVLQTGSIKVSFADGKQRNLTMQPGDRIVYNAATDQLTIGTTDAGNFSAWKEKKLLLHDPSAAEVIQYLEDVFGKKIVLENADLAKRKIEGPILLTNLEDALFVLSTVLNAEIIKKDSNIIIRSR